ncbi:hypothetical protein DFH07DRAFT_953629 [Mycena maculata]|uniref:Transmembrane protein n=1 Tax=Mycena maculata TaxID=230809 RepID=A0AAD7NR20_9AGAR|nr:hypothetical protein DFH07DRAFT_953629 [Mycena maculata]
MRTILSFTVILGLSFVASASVVPGILPPEVPATVEQHFRSRNPMDGINSASPHPNKPAPSYPPRSSNHLKTVQGNPKADSETSTRARVQRGTELVYNPIDSSYSYIRTAPWWARGEEGLWWTRDEKTGVLIAQTQPAATRQESDV